MFRLPALALIALLLAGCAASIPPPPPVGFASGLPRVALLPLENLSARQILRIPTAVKIDDREVIRLKPYIRISTKLVLNLSGAVNDIPNFNPQQIFAAGDQPLPKIDQSCQI